MLRRVNAMRAAGWRRLELPCPARHVRRQCATQAEAKVAPEAPASGTTSAHNTTTTAQPPRRKDWRIHQDVVYVQGVPVKGSLFKLPWYEQLLNYFIFSIAGSVAAYMVRPQIHYLAHHGFLGLPEDAGWRNGPWLYRFLYVLIMYPCYSFILFMVASFFGRRVWFSFMIYKMWARMLTKRAARRLEYFLDIAIY